MYISLLLRDIAFCVLISSNSETYSTLDTTIQATSISSQAVHTPQQPTTDADKDLSKFAVWKLSVLPGCDT